MGGLYKNLLRPLLFRQDSETAHNRTLGLLSFAARSGFARNFFVSRFITELLPVDAFGLRFPNPIGLAAGMDKNAKALPMWERMGFGFCELGGVTSLAQPGNPQPRMFRAVQDEALVNRMGFNNHGAESMARRLEHWKSLKLWPASPVGINLGKSKITPLESAAEDYARSVELLWEHADFFVINVSSPNTPGLRQLQGADELARILDAADEVNRALAKQFAKDAKPVLVKISPDLEWSALDELLAVVITKRVSGIVATNTTLERPRAVNNVLTKVYQQAGGLSGKPLAARSTEVVRYIYRQTGGRLPIIGVGGVFDAEDAWAKIAAGASLIEIYTGLVYEGPAIAKRIVDGLRVKISQRGFQSLGEAIGCENQGN